MRLQAVAFVVGDLGIRPTKSFSEGSAHFAFFDYFSEIMGHVKKILQFRWPNLGATTAGWSTPFFRFYASATLSQMCQVSWGSFEIWDFIFFAPAFFEILFFSVDIFGHHIPGWDFDFDFHFFRYTT